MNSRALDGAAIQASPVSRQSAFSPPLNSVRQGATSSQSPTTQGSASAIQIKPPGVTATFTDPGVDRYGGRIYSTGISDFTLTIMNPNGADMMPPTSQSVRVPNSIFPSVRGGLASDIYLLSPGPERFIARWNSYGMSVDLGKLPVGEIVLALKTCDGYTLRIGDPDKNPDRLVHAVVRTYLSGKLEIWFEDAPGPKGTGRSDRNFTDTVVDLTWEVTDKAVLGNLLSAIKNKEGPARQAAINTLKQINPVAAADAGY